jgi:antitoxin (DNA-binding transcriptional repressor) of toxin-antitoxin stability system
MNTVTVDVAELPSRLQELVTLARNGAEVVVRDATGPVAKLIPAAPAQREWVLGLHPGAMIMAPDFNDYLDEENWEDG